MNNLILTLKKLLRKVLGCIPSPVPTGMAEFNTWADSIINTYKMPTQDMDSIKYALATMIMHSGPTDAYKPKLHFALALNASAAKQVAGSVFREIKERHDASVKAAAQKQNEATQLKAVASLEPVQN